MRNDGGVDEVNNNIEDATVRSRMFEGIRNIQFDVSPGEDVAARIYEYMDQYADKEMYVDGATGNLSSLCVAINGIPGSITTFEGEYNIVTLSGMSLLRATDDGSFQPFRRLTVAVPGQTTNLVGGIVAGPLIASTIVNVRVGVFDGEDGIEANQEPNPNPTPDSGPSGAVENGLSNGFGPDHAG